MNKAYAGTFYLIEADTAAEEKFKTTDMVDMSSTANAYIVEDDLTVGSDVDTVKSGKFNDQYVLHGGTAGAAFDEAGIKMLNSDGTWSYKIYSDNTALERGKEYALIFDQDDIDTDDITASDNTTTTFPNITEAYAAPYVEAPEEIELTTYVANAGETTAKITFLNEDGEALTWWTQANKTGFKNVSMYNVASNAISSTDVEITPTAYDMTKGVMTVTYTGTGDSFAYAKATTTKGIFGADSVELVSGIAEEAAEPMDSMKVSDSGADAKIEFTGLKKAASGTVYLLQGDTTNNNFAKIGAKDLSKAVASSAVEGGSASVVLEDVFDGDMLTTAGQLANKNLFVAVFVPDMQDVYQTKKDGDGSGLVFQLKQKATSVKAGNSPLVVDVTTAWATAAGELTITGLEAYDQFGNLMSAAVANKTAEVSAINTTSTNTESAKAKYDIATNGRVRITLTSTASAATTPFVDKGDGYSVSVLGSTIKVTSVNGNVWALGQSDGTEIKVTVNGTEQRQGQVATTWHATSAAGSVTTAGAAAISGEDAGTTGVNTGVYAADQYGSAMAAGVTLATGLTVYKNAACTTAASATEIGGAGQTTVPTITLKTTTGGQVTAEWSANLANAQATTQLFVKYGTVVYTITDN